MIQLLLSRFVIHCNWMLQPFIFKKIFRDFYTVQFLGFFLLSTLSFYRGDSLMLDGKERDDLQFLQVTSFNYSALNSLVSENCLKFWLPCVFVFVILWGRDVISLLTGPIGFLTCCNLIHHPSLFKILNLLWLLEIFVFKTYLGFWASFFESFSVKL